MWSLKSAFFNKAAYFAVAHILGEENFFRSKKHI